MDLADELGAELVEERRAQRPQRRGRARRPARRRARRRARPAGRRRLPVADHRRHRRPARPPHRDGRRDPRRPPRHRHQRPAADAARRRSRRRSGWAAASATPRSPTIAAWPWTVESIPAFALDVDTAEDLAAVRAATADDHAPRPSTGLPEIGPGDDLAALIAPHVRDGDVARARPQGGLQGRGPRSSRWPTSRHRRAGARAGRRARQGPAPRPGHPRRDAPRSSAVAPGVLICRTHHGFVCANAGVDTSNAPRGPLVLLPRDPDASARALRAALAPTRCAVVIADSFGRAWRARPGRRRDRRSRPRAARRLARPRGPRGPRAAGHRRSPSPTRPPPPRTSRAPARTRASPRGRTRPRALRHRRRRPGSQRPAAPAGRGPVRVRGGPATAPRGRGRTSALGEDRRSVATPAGRRHAKWSEGRCRFPARAGRRPDEPRRPYESPLPRKNANQIAGSASHPTISGTSSIASFMTRSARPAAAARPAAC